MSPLGWFLWGCRIPLRAASPTALLARRTAWNQTRVFESIPTFPRLHTPAWRWRAWMALAAYWEIARATTEGPPALTEEFFRAFYPAFLREAQASVPGRVGGPYDITDAAVRLAPYILTPISTEDDPVVQRVLIVYHVLDWVVEGRARADPEVLVPLTLALLRHSRRVRELVDGLAAQNPQFANLTGGTP
jgi:hypothetical protein